MVPKGAFIGDEVYVLFGGDVPYILRPTAEDKESQFVGHYYVHGIMKGEVAPMVHAKKFEMEEVVLS